MTKTIAAVAAGFVLLAGVASATPPPNDVGTTGMGGGVYYNPYVAKRAGQSVNQDRFGDRVGTAEEGGNLYNPSVSKRD
jgi:hypothetical protein